MNTSSAVYVKNVVKKYGNRTILDGLTMTVERGTIYGLLGASGCGKTTLLSSIVGRNSIQSGDIWVLGKKKGAELPGPKVGYMPQELALVEEFTVKDTLYYFGTIFHMNSETIEKRLAEFTAILDLPPEDRYLKNCSGGQKRRVSLAAALVHYPELIILDEPTVGVDPILREKIWTYIKCQVVKNNLTVIITTHYNEETKDANKVGLMRGGKLLAEESPAKLFSTYQMDSLEEVFLILSQKQEREQHHSLSKVRAVNGNKTNSMELVSTATSVESCAIGFGSEDELTKSSTKKPSKTKTSYMSVISLDTNRMKALLDKNIKQLYRNIVGFAFLVMFPIVQLWFFKNSIGTDPTGLNLGIVNNESFTAFCKAFDWNQTAVIVDDYECHFKNLSCRFLTYLEHPMIKKVLYDTLPEAMDAVKHGKLNGIIYIPSNFSEAFDERLRLGFESKSWDINFGEIKAYMDMSNRETGAILAGKLFKLFNDFQEKLMADCHLSRKLAGLPVQKHLLYLDNEKPMTYFIAPGMILMLIYLLGCTMTSNSIVKDKVDGVWDRSIVAGVSSLEITLAHLLLEGTIMIVQSIEATVMLFFILKLDYIGNIYTLFLFVYLMGLCGIAYGFFISSVSNGVTQANLLCTGGYLPLLLIGGVIWPIEAMPPTLQLISMLLPGTIPILSFRNVMSKGWPLWDSQVMSGLGVALVWIGIFTTASIFFVKINK